MLTANANEIHNRNFVITVFALTGVHCILYKHYLAVVLTANTNEIPKICVMLK